MGPASASQADLQQLAPAKAEAAAQARIVAAKSTYCGCARRASKPWRVSADMVGQAIPGEPHVHVRILRENRRGFPLFRVAGRHRSRDRRRHRQGTRPPARRDRADRLGEHRQPRGARGAGLGADQQIRRRPAGQALLRRLPVRRHRREPRDRPREEAVRRGLRQRPAAFRRVRQCRGVHGADAAGRHVPRIEPRRRRSSHPRLAGQLFRQVVQGGALRRAPRRPSHRHGRGARSSRRSTSPR